MKIERRVTCRRSRGLPGDGGTDRSHEQPVHPIRAPLINSSDRSAEKVTWEVAKLARNIHQASRLRIDAPYHMTRPEPRMHKRTQSLQETIMHFDEHRCLSERRDNAWIQQNTFTAFDIDQKKCLGWVGQKHSQLAAVTKSVLFDLVCNAVAPC